LAPFFLYSQPLRYPFSVLKPLLDLLYGHAPSTIISNTATLDTLSFERARLLAANYIFVDHSDQLDTRSHGPPTLISIITDFHLIQSACSQWRDFLPSSTRETDMYPSQHRQYIYRAIVRTQKTQLRREREWLVAQTYSDRNMNWTFKSMACRVPQMRGCKSVKGYGENPTSCSPRSRGLCMNGQRQLARGGARRNGSTCKRFTAFLIGIAGAGYGKAFRISDPGDHGIMGRATQNNDNRTGFNQEFLFCTKGHLVLAYLKFTPTPSNLLSWFSIDCNSTATPVNLRNFNHSAILPHQPVLGYRAESTKNFRLCKSNILPLQSTHS